MRPQMVVPTSDLSTLEKVDVSGINVTTYRAAYTKQARTPLPSLAWQMGGLGCMC